jgi:hypothetical protein
MTWFGRCVQRCLKWLTPWRRASGLEASAIPSPVDTRVHIETRYDAGIGVQMVLAPELPPGLHKTAWLLSECWHDERVRSRGGLADGAARGG